MQHEPPITSRSAGGVVLGDAGTIALVRERDGHAIWVLPKGAVEPGEDDETAARREVCEETGLCDLEYLDDLGTYRRHAVTKDGLEDATQYKEVHMFLFAAPPHAALTPNHEIAAARWVSLPHAIEEIGWPVERAWFTRVFQRIRLAIQRD